MTTQQPEALRRLHAENITLQSSTAPADVAGAEHELKDVRCECCGYMTYHREHTGCIRAAYAARAARNRINHD